MNESEQSPSFKDKMMMEYSHNNVQYQSMSMNGTSLHTKKSSLNKTPGGSIP